LDFSRVVFLEEDRALIDDVIEDRTSKISDDSFTDPGHKEETKRTRDAHQEGHADQAQKVVIDHGGVLGREALVDHHPNRQWDDEHDTRRGHEGEKSRHHDALVGRDEGNQAT